MLPWSSTALSLAALLLIVLIAAAMLWRRRPKPRLHRPWLPTLPSSRALEPGNGLRGSGLAAAGTALVDADDEEDELPFPLPFVDTMPTPHDVAHDARA